MSDTLELKNQAAIKAFLQNNDISFDDVMNFTKRFETAYYVGDSRKFYEETTVGFNVLDTNTVNALLVDINGIEFETEFRVKEQTFEYDDTNETLTIQGKDSQKHNEEYKIVINSQFLDF